MFRKKQSLYPTEKSAQTESSWEESLGMLLVISCLLGVATGCDSSSSDSKKTVASDSGSQADNGGGSSDSDSSDGSDSTSNGVVSSADKFVADAYCSRTAGFAFDACKHEVQEDRLIGKATCINFEDEDDRTECVADIAEAFDEDDALCQDQFDARLAVCGKLGEARYDPDFDPANFVDPDEIGMTVAVNPYFPLVVGNRWVWEGGDERITDVVTDKTKLIEGVTCRVVSNVAEEDGDVIEITDDWFAQDVAGNIWYCGESARDFETFEGDKPEEPELVEIDGSWKVGVDYAKSGLILPFAPQVGQAFREEVLLGDAEDFAEVLSLSANVSVSATEFSCSNDCLETNNTSPIEPDVQELKYYKPGIGLILEFSPGEPKVELVEFTQATP